MTPQALSNEPPEAQDELEVEWQFDARDLDAAASAVSELARALSLTVTPTGTRTLVDQYLDTPDWAFRRAGYALRVRNEDGRAEACLKAITSQSEGPRQRREICEPLVGPDRLALVTAEGPVTERVRAIAGPRELRRLFTVRTRRGRLELRDGDELLAEVALDATAIEPNGHGAARTLQRVELELESPAAYDRVEALALALGERHDFGRAAISKFGAGIEAAGLEVAPDPDLGPTDIDAVSTIGELAYAALRRQLAAYLVNEPGTRLGEDIEALHDMRVASRRLRSAMQIFADALPPDLLLLGDELKWVADALGEVRDLDVQLEWLRAEAAAHPDATDEAGSPLDPVVDRLEQHRVEARQRMLAALDSARHAILIDALSARLRTGDVRAGTGDAPALEAAPRLVRRPWKRFRRRAERLRRRSPDADYHAARIRAKRMRYAAEFVADLYGKPARRLIREAKRVQDELGRRQDATVTIERLRRIALEEPLPASAIFAVGELAERERETMLGISGAFPDHYRELRRRWKRLDAALAAGASGK